MNFGANPETASGDFLKIEPNQKVIGIFRGEPREFYARFVDKKSHECKSNEPGAKFRFRINFIIRNDEGEYAAKVWEQGALVYNSLKELNEEFDLEKTIVSIKRNGEGFNTSYTILPTSKRVDEELEKTLSLVELKPLVTQEQPPMPTGEYGPDIHEEIPF